MDKQERLANEDVKTLLIKFSIPAIIAMLITALYNIVNKLLYSFGASENTFIYAKEYIFIILM